MAGKHKSKSKISDTSSEVSRSTQSTNDDVIKLEASFTNPRSDVAAEDGLKSSSRFQIPICLAQQGSADGGGTGGTMAFKFAATVFMNRLKAKLRARESKKKSKKWDDGAEFDIANHLGPKMSQTSDSLNLMQSDDLFYDQPASNVEICKSCENSPRRTRPHPDNKDQNRDDLETWQTWISDHEEASDNRQLSGHSEYCVTAANPADHVQRSVCGPQGSCSTLTKSPQLRAAVLPVEYHHDKQQTSSCVPRAPSRSRSPAQHCSHCSTYDRHFNADADAAASIRTAVQKTASHLGSHQHATAVKEGLKAGICISTNRLLYSPRCQNNYVPKLHIPPSFVKVRPRSLEETPQGLATVLSPKTRPIFASGLQKRVPRGLAAVILDQDAEATTEQQTDDLSLVGNSSSHDIFQEYDRALVSSAQADNSRRLMTNMGMNEETRCQMPPVPECNLSTESITNSSTPTRKEMSVLQQQQQQGGSDFAHGQLRSTPITEGSVPSSTRTGRRWDEFLQMDSAVQTSSSEEFNSFQVRESTGAQTELSSLRRTVDRANRKKSGTRMSSSGSDVSSSSQCDLNKHELQEGMSYTFNERAESSQKPFPRDSLEVLYSNRVAAAAPFYQAVERREIGDMHETSNFLRARPQDLNAYGSCATSTGSAIPSVTTSSSSGGGPRCTSSQRRSNINPMAASTTTLRNSPQQQFYQPGRPENFPRPARRLDLDMHTSGGEQSYTNPGSTSVGTPITEIAMRHTQLTAPGNADSPSRFTPNESNVIGETVRGSSDNSPALAWGRGGGHQNISYAKLVAEAKKSQMILDETKAALSSKIRSQSKSSNLRSQTGVEAARAPQTAAVTYLPEAADSEESADEFTRSSSTLPYSAALDASTSKSSDQTWDPSRPQNDPVNVLPHPQVGLTYKDRMTSITHLLNSMNSITQLLNAIPLQSEDMLQSDPAAGGNLQNAEDYVSNYDMPLQDSASRINAGSSEMPVMPPHSDTLPNMEAQSTFDRPEDFAAYGEAKHPSLRTQKQLVDDDDMPHPQLQFEVGARGDQDHEYGQRSLQTQEMNLNYSPQQPSNPHNLGTQVHSGSLSTQQSEGQLLSSTGQRQTIAPRVSTAARPSETLIASNSSQSPSIDVRTGMPGQWQQPGYTESRSPKNSIQATSQSSIPLETQVSTVESDIGIVQESRSQSLRNAAGRLPSFPSTTVLQRSSMISPRSSQYNYTPEVQNQTEYQIAEHIQRNSSSRKMSNRVPQNFNPGMEGGILPVNSVADQTPANMPQQDDMMNHMIRRESSNSAPDEVQLGSTRSQPFAPQIEAPQLPRSSRAHTFQQYPTQEFQNQPRSTISIPSPVPDQYGQFTEEDSPHDSEAQLPGNTLQDLDMQTSGSGGSLSAPDQGIDIENVTTDEPESHQAQEQHESGYEEPSVTAAPSYDQQNSATQAAYFPQQAQGMAANYQPTSQPQTLGQVPHIIKSQVKRLNGGSHNPITPSPSAMLQLFDLSRIPSHIITSAQTFTNFKYSDMNTAWPSVGEIQKPPGFQNNLFQVSRDMPRQFDLVKPQPAAARNSLSNTVDTMLRELEVLESRSRQNSVT